MSFERLAIISNYLSSRLKVYCPSAKKLNKQITELELEAHEQKVEMKQFKADVKSATDKMVAALNEMEKLDAINNTMFELTPSWGWLKYIDKVDGRYITGRYKKANNLICSELFYGLRKEDIIDHTDAEIALKLRSEHGKKNHTFGELCGNSDQIVIDMRQKGTFLESGKVNGKMLYVIVYKDVICDAVGKPIYTVGTGINITEDYIYLHEVMKLTTDEATKRLLKAHLRRNQFQPDQSIKVDLNDN